MTHTTRNTHDYNTRTRTRTRTRATLGLTSVKRVLTVLMLISVLLAAPIAGVAAAEEEEEEEDSIERITFDTELTTEGVQIDDVNETQDELTVYFDYETLNETLNDSDTVNVTVETPVMNDVNVETTETLAFDANADETESQSVTVNVFDALEDDQEWDDSAGVLLTTDTVDADEYSLAESTDDESIIGGADLNGDLGITPVHVIGALVFLLIGGVLGKEVLK